MKLVLLNLFPAEDVLRAFEYSHEKFYDNDTFVISKLFKYFQKKCLSVQN